MYFVVASRDSSMSISRQSSVSQYGASSKYAQPAPENDVSRMPVSPSLKLSNRATKALATLSLPKAVIVPAKRRRSEESKSTSRMSKLSRNGIACEVPHHWPLPELPSRHHSNSESCRSGRRHESFLTL